MTLDKVKKQRIALYLSEHKLHGGMIWRQDPELYYKLKQEADKIDPVHSIVKQADIHDRYHEILSGGSKDDAFIKQLAEVGMTSTDYLYTAKMRAHDAGYDANKLSLANDGIHKLKYESPTGIKKFGRIKFNDFIIWKHLEQSGQVDPGYANMKRHVYHQSHEKISRIHKLDKYSPNALSLAINW
jgi:hypothetical protein